MKFTDSDRYAAPRAETSGQPPCPSLLCQSELEDDGGIPDLTEDIFEW